jgi:hypothetical protein
MHLLGLLLFGSVGLMALSLVIFLFVQQKRPTDLRLQRGLIWVASGFATVTQGTIAAIGLGAGV